MNSEQYTGVRRCEFGWWNTIQARKKLPNIREVQ